MYSQNVVNSSCSDIASLAGRNTGSASWLPALRPYRDGPTWAPSDFPSISNWTVYSAPVPLGTKCR